MPKKTSKKKLQNGLQSGWQNSSIQALHNFFQIQKNGLEPRYTEELLKQDDVTHYRVTCNIVFKGKQLTFVEEGTSKKKSKRRAALQACEYIWEYKA